MPPKDATPDRGDRDFGRSRDMPRDSGRPRDFDRDSGRPRDFDRDSGRPRDFDRDSGRARHVTPGRDQPPSRGIFDFYF